MSDLAFQLICVAGAKKGGYWPVGTTPLLIGRGPDCDIKFADPMISRRHCQLTLSGDSVLFEELGSRNPVLVNGVPHKKCVLKRGDEIAVGKELFLLTKGAGPIASIMAEDEEGETIAIEVNKLLSGAKGTIDLGKHGRPRTIHDLAALFESATSFGTAKSMAELLSLVSERVSERFRPRAWWLVRHHGEEDLTVYQPEGTELEPGREAPLELIQKSLRERKGLLIPESERSEDKRTVVTTMVAPMALGDLVTGALVVQSELPQEPYQQADLTFLLLLGQALAPFMHTAEAFDQLHRDNLRLRAQVGESWTIVGKSRGIGHVRGQIAKVAKSDISVLVTGETGTGKELVARMLHAQSLRASGPLVTVNCAAIPRELFESEIFGYEKGAFTGATKTTPGLLVQAHGGTLFLDEVGDLSPESQARILRAIELGTFRALGAKEESRVDVRVVSATNRDLPIAIQNGGFREDLFHRLCGFEIHVPPLRERPSDIPILAEHFLELGKTLAKRPLAGISPEAMDLLSAYHWHGNVRELRNCIQRAIAVARRDWITPADLVGLPKSGPASQMCDETPASIAEVEKRHIEEALRYYEGNVTVAAKTLGIGRSTLYKKLAEYDIAT